MEHTFAQSTQVLKIILTLPMTTHDTLMTPLMAILIITMMLDAISPRLNMKVGNMPLVKMDLP